MIRMQLVTITPALASDYLAGNSINRPLRKRVVERYADDMKKGRWEITHQGIAVDNDGTLLDGQHRLHAVIKAGVPVKMMVTVGIDSSAFANIDKLVPRTDADSLRIDRRVVECAKYFLSFTRTFTKPSIVDVADVCGRIDGMYNKHMHGKNVRIYSCVPIRCAVLLAMHLKPGDEQSIANQYLSLISQNYETMKNGTKMLSKSLNIGQISLLHSTAARSNLFCKALPVFLGERDSNVKLVAMSQEDAAKKINLIFGDIIAR